MVLSSGDTGARALVFRITAAVTARGRAERLPRCVETGMGPQGPCGLLAREVLPGQGRSRGAPILLRLSGGSGAWGAWQAGRRRFRRGPLSCASVTDCPEPTAGYPGSCRTVALQWPVVLVARRAQKVSGGRVT